MMRDTHSAAEKRKDRTKAVSICMTLALFCGQMEALYMFPASAQELEYEGTTQIAAEDVYAELDTNVVSLVIEEVYVAAGDRISEGDRVLKITDDSFQEALDYYEASIIYAENTLTTTQLEYAQGTQEAQYTLELAQAEAEQAEFVRSQSVDELEDTIAEHEEVMTELEEAIAEYKEGIADGSYESSSSSGSGASSGSSSSKGSNSGDQEKESETEAISEDMTEEIDLSQPESEEGRQPESGGQTQPESGIENMPGDTGDGSQQQSAVAALEKAIAQQQSVIAELEDQKTQLEDQIERKDTAYNEIMKKLYEAAGLDTSQFCGVYIAAETQGENSGSENAESETAGSEPEIPGANKNEGIPEMPEHAGAAGSDFNAQQAVLESNEQAKTSSAEVLPEETQAETAAADVQTSAPETEPQTSAPETEPQTTAPDAEGQNSLPETEGDIIQTEDVSEDQTGAPETERQTGDIQIEIQDPTGPESSESDNETEYESESETEHESESETEHESESETEHESESETEQEELLENLLVQLNAMEAGRKELYVQLETVNVSLESAQEKLEILETQLEEAKDVIINENAGGTTEPGTGTLPEGTDQSGAESGSMPSVDSSSLSGMSSGVTFSGSGQSVSMGSSGQSVSMGGSGQSMSMGGSGQDSTSLFGDEYDLTEVQNLLERTVSSTEEAEELLEQLLEAQETVAVQYEELLREEEATRLDIQYTCDSAVIAGKLAEVTYQQQTEEWETTLADAQKNLEELKTAKQILDEMEDGVLTASVGGTVAAVNYEAEDALSDQLALYSVYQTDTVTVPIEVSQYEIAQFQVGDTVEVKLGGMFTLEGTVSEKAAEPTSGTSRTEVIYQVTVSLDNAQGMLSSGTSAVVTMQEAE